MCAKEVTAEKGILTGAMQQMNKNWEQVWLLQEKLKCIAIVRHLYVPKADAGGKGYYLCCFSTEILEAVPPWVCQFPTWLPQIAHSGYQLPNLNVACPL